MLFKPDKFVEEQVGLVSERIKGKAIIACSGGVDSMVAAVIVSKAIGDRLLAVYVDTGLMRKGETDEVRDMLTEMGLNFRIVDASKEYFDSLKGVTEPEQKRKIIGEKFIRVFEREAKVRGFQRPHNRPFMAFCIPMLWYTIYHPCGIVVFSKWL